jgi:D-2-hydroxyacid dehydrogenase (NADP+)
VKVLVLDAAARDWAARLTQAAPGYAYLAASDAAAAVPLAREAEIIVGLAHAIPGAVLAAAPKLRWVQALTTGTDPLDRLPELRPEVVVTAMRGIQGPQMSELCFLMMLALLRDIRGILARQEARIWDRRPQPLLSGRTAVILGVGAIAEYLAARCKAFGMRVIGISNARMPKALHRAALTEAAAKADFLIVLVPASDATRHIVDARVLGAMRRDAFLINIARGAVVDEAALAACLAAGGIAGAGLDVFGTEPLPPESPLWGLPNAIITPHVGGVSDIYMEQALPAVAENLRAFREGGEAALRNRVTRG